MRWEFRQNSVCICCSTIVLYKGSRNLLHRIDLTACQVLPCIGANERYSTSNSATKSARSPNMVTLHITELSAGPFCSSFVRITRTEKLFIYSPKFFPPYPLPPPPPPQLLRASRTLCQIEYRNNITVHVYII